jgi:hypothetical protein
MTTTPYRRGQRGEAVWVRVVSARRIGRHVELTTEAGKTFLVDLTHPVFDVKDAPDS